MGGVVVMTIMMMMVVMITNDVSRGGAGRLISRFRCGAGTGGC